MRREISVCKKGWVRSMRHTFIKKKMFAISNTLRASRNIFLDVFFIATMEYFNKIVAMDVTLFHGEDIFSARRHLLLLHSAKSAPNMNFIWDVYAIGTLLPPYSPNGMRNKISRVVDALAKRIYAFYFNNDRPSR